MNLTVGEEDLHHHLGMFEGVSNHYHCPRKSHGGGGGNAQMEIYEKATSYKEATPAIADSSLLSPSGGANLAPAFDK